MTDRLIRDPNRKWRLLGSKPIKPITWRTSEKGNKWFKFKHWHVVVFPVVQEHPYGKLVWHVRISKDTDVNKWDAIAKQFDGEEVAMAWALQQVGLVKSLDGTLVEDPVPAPDLPEVSGRRIKT